MSAEHTKHTYAPGMTPLAIATRIVELAKGAPSLIMDDADKWDGRVSVVLRYKRMRFILAAYPTSHHPRILEALRRSHHMRGRTTFGMAYDTYDAQLSGKEDTTAMNTDDHAFLDYVRLRRLNQTPDDAYANLGVYGGDDGVLVGTGDVTADTAHVTKVFGEAGQVLEVQVVQRGQPGVNFLNRFFGPGVWHGDANSMADVRRALAKWHVSCNMPPGVTRLRKLAEKAGNYVLTDPNTPLLSIICRAVTSVLTPNGKYRELNSWYGREERSVQFPNEEADWMEDMVEEWLPGYRLDLVLAWTRTIRNDLANSYDPDKTNLVAERVLLGPPLIFEADPRPPKEDAIVAGVLHAGTTPFEEDDQLPMRPLPDLPGSDHGAKYVPPTDPCRWCVEMENKPDNHWNAACPMMAAANMCGRCGKDGHLATGDCPKRKCNKCFERGGQHSVGCPAKKRNK
jgi:hypothetical protein